MVRRADFGEYGFSGIYGSKNTPLLMRDSGFTSKKIVESGNCRFSINLPGQDIQLPLLNH